MKVFVSLLPGVDTPKNPMGASVVIDVLRATTVVTTALAAGARDVVTCVDVEEAFELARTLGRSQTLLCGERHCQLIEGFDLGNSPAEYTKPRVSGRSLVMTTTNGTRAIAAADEDAELFLASFRNLSALVRRLESFASIHVICAGTDGEITGEDVGLCGAILAMLSRSNRLMLGNDAAKLALDHCATRGLLDDVGRRIASLTESLGGRNLRQAGFESDVRFCAEMDVTDVVPRRVSRSPQRFVAS